MLSCVSQVIDILMSADLFAGDPHMEGNDMAGPAGGGPARWPPAGPDGPFQGQFMHQQVGRHCLHVHCLAVSKLLPLQAICLSKLFAFAGYLPVQAISICKLFACASYFHLQAIAFAVSKLLPQRPFCNVLLQYCIVHVACTA